MDEINFECQCEHCANKITGKLLDCIFGAIIKCENCKGTFIIKRQ